MRSFWTRIPMLRLAFAMIAGISLEIAADNGPRLSLPLLWLSAFVLTVSLIFVLVIANIKNVTLSYKLRWGHGLALNTGIIAFAYLLTWFYTQKNYSQNFSNFLSDKNVLVVKISEPPVLRDKVVMANAEVTEVNNTNGHFLTTGNIQLSFLRDSVCEQLNYGDELLVKSKIDTTEGPKNPYEFNFKTYQAFHNIYHKAFVTSSEWDEVAHNRGNCLLSAIYHLRNNFLKIIALYVKDKNDFGIATAIMLGYRDYINADIMRAYASSGAVHVLSVSGLHVSIMFFMLNFLLSWMDRRQRKMVIAKAAVIIIFIWFYACLTGLSPPVMRSAMMFTLIQLGDVFIRSKNTYNIVAGSAVVLMLFNPFVITDVGFQLSYIAVFGIVYLQPKIANLYILEFPEGPHYKRHNNWLSKALIFAKYDLKWFASKTLDFFWQLIAASIAAQIATLPLCLLYFYQFPNLFLLSNIVVIPLSEFILYAGTALFAVAHVPYVNGIAGGTFNHLLVWLNKFIFWIDTLPYALTRGICISTTEMILLYLLILFICWLTEARKNKIFISVLVVFLLLCSFRSFKKMGQAGLKEMVVYSTPKQRAIAFITDKTLYYDIDTALYNNQNNMLFHIYHHWWESGVAQRTSLQGSEISKPGIYSSRIAQGRIVLFEGKKILIVDSLSAFDLQGGGIKLNPDLVILSGTLKVSIPILKKTVDFDEVVFDSSCKPASRKRWKKDCSELNINYWDVSTEGAYVWNMINDQP